MYLYASEPRGFASNFPRQLQRIAKLHQSGYLDEDSIVWVNTNAISPIFWAFNGIASMIYWFEAPTAGYVRLSTDRIRWAATYGGAKEAPVLDLPLANLRVGSERETKLTFVVDNTFMAPEAVVGVSEGRDSHPMEGKGGFYQGVKGLSVVDLPRFDRSRLPAATGDRLAFEEGFARYQGVELLAAGMNTEARAHLINNTSDYRIELPNKMFTDILYPAIDTFRQAANQISGKLFGDSHIDTADPEDSD